MSPLLPQVSILSLLKCLLKRVISFISRHMVAACSHIGRTAQNPSIYCGHALPFCTCISLALTSHLRTRPRAGGNFSLKHRFPSRTDTAKMFHAMTVNPRKLETIQVQSRCRMSMVLRAWEGPHNVSGCQAHIVRTFWPRLWHEKSLQLNCKMEADHSLFVHIAG